MAEKTSGPAQHPTQTAGITKVEAVRRALAELGTDAPPTQIQGWIKDQLDVEMNTDHISTTKSALRRKVAGKATSAAKKPAPTKRPVQQASQAAADGAGKGRGGISLTDIAAVKDLVGRVGADQLRALLDVLGK
jgi:hypothetical protein